ncbi:MAG TPA: phytanoyl-CoA dioxygenase family protein [Alphaproteobacteria bacterium]|nr:phytanoyl-CoA dioxygenase family protein [Alphaproteobacteria bacterium]
MSGISRDEAFLRNGWLQIDLASRKTLDAVRTGLLELLRRDYPAMEDLESYHRHVLGDDEHIAVQKRLFDWFIASGHGPAIVGENLAFFRDLLGPDLHVQTSPYLRIVRPAKPGDNVNIHRDTHYGGSPYELSVHVPFTDCGLAGSLALIPGSHVEADGAYPYEQIVDPTTPKGSVKHQLGFTYAPKVMQPADLAKLTPIETRFGQALVFSLSAVHGQVVNSSTVTRFSTDVRVVHSHAPIDWARNEATGYYRPLSRSAVSAAAEAYFAADAAYKTK